MGMWLEQEPTIKELIAARDNIRWGVEHQFYWNGQVKVDEVRDNTSLKGKAFDTVRERFANCECSLARDYVRYCAFLKEALINHSQFVTQIFYGEYGTRWYLDEINEEIAKIQRELAIIAEQITVCERYAKQLTNAVGVSLADCSGLVAANSLVRNLLGFRQRALNVKLQKLLERRDKMLRYNNHQKILDSYENAMKLGSAIKADLQRVRSAAYDPKTGNGAFSLPGDFGKERGDFWGKWGAKQKAKEKFWSREEVDRFLREINVSYSLSDADDRPENNCMFTAFALYMRLNNIDPEAVAPLWKSNGDYGDQLFIYSMREGSGSEDMSNAGFVPNNYDENNATKSFTDGIDAALRKHGKGANAFLSIRWEGGGEHALNVYFDGENVWVLDSQLGEQYSLQDYLEKYKNIGGWSISPVYTPTNPYRQEDPF